MFFVLLFRCLFLRIFFISIIIKLVEFRRTASAIINLVSVELLQTIKLYNVRESAKNNGIYKSKWNKPIAGRTDRTGDNESQIPIKDYILSASVCFSSHKFQRINQIQRHLTVSFAFGISRHGHGHEYEHTHTKSLGTYI